MKRGQVWIADLGEGLGSEQNGTRPVVIIQNDVGNLHSPTTIVAPITDNHKRHMPTHQKIWSTEKPSVVLLEQIRTICKSRLQFHTGEYLSKSEMSGVDQKILISLGLAEVKEVKKQR
ncbi:type II toxin-antitoxin system PemK/MazF family toxin [Paenibacillus sp. FSL R5-0810]|uniref:type II toxin-antitoxin system PemK/MazF family toxin n=1 Tax=Paenibacillus sp. FSL R5-0810 TaxID=2921659 RepID=UPI0030FBA273